MADLALPNWPIDQNECIGDSLSKINDWFNSIKDFVNKPLLKDAIWITQSTTAIADWHGRVVIAKNSVANSDITVTLPSGLPAGFDVTVIRYDTTADQTGGVRLFNNATSAVKSTPTNDFTYLAFPWSIAGAYHPGGELLNTFILFGDLLP